MLVARPDPDAQRERADRGIDESFISPLGYVIFAALGVIVHVVVDEFRIDSTTSC